MKRVLITGKNSYIGQNVENWLNQYPEQYYVETVGTRNDEWKHKDFSGFDVVFHVAGIAHVSTDPKMEEAYYKVNRDLTIDVATKAKEETVKQFIFMSSIIVYGDSTSTKRVITKDTVPTPSNFYGDSKLQAEQGIQELQAHDFNVVILRPPMIYGKGSKGNYPRLAKLARTTPIFPDFDNERSMLFIDNLCEFIKLMIDNNEQGIFFPQNKEYVNTSNMVREIAKAHNKKIWFTKLFNPIIRLMIGRVNVVNKVFGNLTYEKEVSNFELLKHQIRSFEDSISATEKSAG